VLARALRWLRRELARTRFGLPLHLAEQAEHRRVVLVNQLDDYLLPRLARLDAPILAVVGGSTGSGKSTLVNSLLGAAVSPAGVLRPTTRAPVLVCNPDDAAWFTEAHLLPDLPREGTVAEGPLLRVLATPEVPSGIALLDAPDIDSVVDANRELAGQLLGAADLWLFLTTAARYADAVPWDVLRDAKERGAAVALVLDRIPDEGRDIVIGHLRQMLVDQGFGDAPMFFIGEQRLDDQGLLPGSAVAPVRQWLAGLARDSEIRDAVIRQTLSGAIASTHPRVAAIAVQADAQRDAVAVLRSTVQQAYADALDKVDAALRDGALLRGEVLARWHELVGSGDLTRALEARIGRLRDRIRAAITGRPLPGHRFTAALTSGVAALVTAAVSDAAEQTATQWAAQPAGRALLESTGELRPKYRRPSADLEQRAERLLGDWQRGVLELVRAEVGNKRSVARLTAYAVNATGLLVMIGVFASTAFIPTGAEIAVAGGTTVASQKLLEAIFGDRAVRQLADRARQDLLDRVQALLEVERQRYTDLLDQAGVDPATPERLREAVGEVERARVGAGFVATGDVLPGFPAAGEPPASPEAAPERKADPAPKAARGSSGTARRTGTARGTKESTVQKPTKTTRRKR
jgi:energy-coupling factor transporter ATP-binding protein EcfA2